MHKLLNFYPTSHHRSSSHTLAHHPETKLCQDCQSNASHEHTSHYSIECDRHVFCQPVALECTSWPVAATPWSDVVNRSHARVASQLIDSLFTQLARE